MSRFLCMSAILSAVLAVARPAIAQSPNNTWIGTANGNWSAAANWDANGVPVNAATTIVQFNGGNSTIYTSTQDIASGFQLNGLISNQTGPLTTVTSATGDSLTFVSNGSIGPFIDQNSTGGITLGSSTSPTITFAASLTLGGGGTGNISLSNPVIFQGSTITLAGVNTTSNAGGAALPSSAFTVTGNGIGNISFSGVLTGSPTSFTINTNASNYGSGSVTLGAANTFTASGGVILQSGNLAITNAAGLGNASNVLTIDGGALRGGASAAVPNPIVMNNTNLLFVGANAELLSGPITVNGTAGLQVFATGMLTLENTSGFNGPTTVGLAGIATNTTASGASLSIASTSTTNGTLLNTTSITVNTGANSTSTGNFIINETGGYFGNRIASTTPITLNNGRFSFLVGGTLTNTQTDGNVTAYGFAGIGTTIPTGNTVNTSLSFENLTLNDNATIGFRGDIIGTSANASASNTVVTFANGPFTGLAPSGSGATPILPWAAGYFNANGNSTTLSSLVTPDGNGVRVMNPSSSSDFNTVAGGSPLVAGQNNYLASGSPSAISAGTTLQVNSLLLAASAAVLSGGPGSVLQVYSGTIMTSSIAAISVPTLAFGATPAYLYAPQPMLMNSSITGSAGVVVTGYKNPSPATELNLNSPNPFTGGLTINGTLAVNFADNRALGAAGGGITFGGGTLQSFMPGSFALTRPIFLTPAGGALSASGNINNMMTLNAALVSGTGPLSIVGGTIALSGTASGAWSTAISGGILQFSSASNFGSGPIFLNGGTFQPTTSGTFNLPLQVNSLQGVSSSTIDVGSQNLTISAPISALGYGIGAAQSTTLTKAGVGTLTLTANNPFTGILSVSAGSLTLSGAGALPNLGNTSNPGATVSAGASFTVDNTASNNPARFNAPLALNGGSFNLLGNGGGTATTIGTLQSLSYGSVLSLTPASGASLQLTASSLLFTPSTAAVVIAGTGLGSTGANSSQMFFNSPPAQTNGIMPGVVGDTSPTGGGSFLVTYSATNGIIPATLTPAGGTITTTTANLLASGSTTVPSSATVNSLTLAPGTSVSSSGATITLTTGMLVAQSGAASSTDTNTTIATATAGPLVIATAGNANLTINGPITFGILGAANNSLVKLGAGTLALAGSPSMTTGTITIGAGTLEIPASTTTQCATIASNATGTLSVDGMLNLAGTGQNTLFGPVVGAGSILRTTGATGTQTFAGPVSIAGGLESDAGTMTFLGNVASAAAQMIIGGNLFANNATLQVAPGVTISRGIDFQAGGPRSFTYTTTNPGQAAATLMGAVTLDPGLALTISSANATTNITGPISGTGNVTLTGGTLNLLSAGNSQSGALALQSGSEPGSATLGLGSSNALGTSTVTVSGSSGSTTISGGGYLQALGGALTIANSFTVSQASSAPTILGLIGNNPLTLSGSVDATSSNLVIDNRSANGSVLTISTVSGSASAGGANITFGMPSSQTNVGIVLPFTPVGNVVSVGTLSNGGTVTVAGGVLRITGSATATDEGSDPTGPITVTQFGTLGGTGTINRNTEIAGTIAPGTGGASGTLTFNNAMVWDAGGKYAFAYSAVTGLSAGVNYNTISSSSTLDVSGVTSTSPFTINITRVGSPGTTGGPVTYTLGSFSGGITGFSASDFAVTGTYSGTPVVSVDNTGDLLQLSFTPTAATAWTWTGNTSGSWSVGTNWSPTSTPASDSNTQLSFGATSNAAMINDIPGTLTLNSMTFNAGSPVYTLNGNGLNFVTNSSGTLPTLVSNSSNSVTINTALTLTNNLTVSGSGNITLGGVISGASSLTMAGSGVLTLTNTANAYSGGTNVLSGTLQVAADADLGTGNVIGAAAGTLAFTGTTTTARSFAMAGGTITVASSQTVILNGSVVSGATLDGTGTFATSATNGAQFLTVTSTPSVAIASNSAKDQFVHFTNSAALTFVGGLNPTVSTAISNLNGFTNEGSGAVTIGAGSAINAANFQTYGTLTLAPNTTSAPTVFTNTGTAPLGFNGGSRTFIGTSATADPTGQNIVDYLDLHGQNAIVAGGLFVNNGGVYDTVGAGTGTIIADFGSLVKGAGFYQNTVKTQNGGKFQTGNSPGSATFGNFVFGPGGVSNYIFAIDDATGQAGPSPGPSGLVSGWGLIKAVQVPLGTGTTPGSFTWTATPASPLTVAIDTLVNPTMSGTDVAGPMADFDPNQPYSWTAAHWTGTYAGPSDVAALDADTSFDTTSFANPIAGTFGWSLDSADQTLSLVYTPTSVPEPGTLALVSLAVAGGACVRLRRARRVG